MHGSLMFEYHYIMNCIGCRQNSLTEYSYGNLSLDIAIDHEQLPFLHVNERKKRNKRPETNNRARTIIIGKINGVCCNLNTRTENCFRSSSQGLILMLCMRFHTHFQSFAMEKWTKFINKVISQCNSFRSSFFSSLLWPDTTDYVVFPLFFHSKTIKRKKLNPEWR